MYRKTKAQIICDAVCGILMLVSILVFILIGIFSNVWHPTWVIIPCSGIVCSIVSIIINTWSKLSMKNNDNKMENFGNKDISQNKNP